MADVVYLRSYDDRTRVDDETARRVMNATVELLRDVPYSSITMRSIAKRAAVSHAEIRAHFRSKDAIVAEIYLERLRVAPLIVDVDESARARIAAQFPPKLTFGRESASESRPNVDLDRISDYSPRSRRRGGHSCHR